jgi:hypothetical protein
VEGDLVEVADPAEALSGPDHMAEYLVRPNAWEISPVFKGRFDVHVDI